MDNKRKKSKNKTPLIITIIAIIIVIVIIAIVIKTNNKTSYDGNSLIGTFIYEKNNTRYEFKENGTGSMSFGDYKYEYSYKTENGELAIDFVKEEAHDVKYTYHLQDGILTLVSVEGTVSIGTEYTLKKENK